MSNEEILLALRLVGAFLLLAAVAVMIFAYRRRREASGLVPSLVLLLIFNGFMLVASFAGERWPQFEMTLLVAALILLPIIFWLVWKNFSNHLRAVGLLAGSDKQD
jgi:hypothetical protein